jgi:hypothetical protein
VVLIGSFNLLLPRRIIAHSEAPSRAAASDPGLRRTPQARRRGAFHREKPGVPDIFPRRASRPAVNL